MISSPTAGHIHIKLFHVKHITYCIIYYIINYITPYTYLYNMHKKFIYLCAHFLKHICYSYIIKTKQGASREGDNMKQTLLEIKSNKYQDWIITRERRRVV